MTSSFGPGFVLRGPHGVIVGRPIDPAVVRDELLSRIHPDEAALAQTWGDLRVRTFVAGRLALREALREIGDTANVPILRSPRGAPVTSSGVSASISHKDTLAVALATRANVGHVGVDVELLSLPREDVSRHVLTEVERGELAVFDAETRKRELLLRFSLKEALYKALDPYVQRYVGFLEVEVRPTKNGTALFSLALKNGEGPFVVEGTHAFVGDAIVTTSRVVTGDHSNSLIPSRSG